MDFGVTAIGNNAKTRGSLFSDFVLAPKFRRQHGIRPKGGKKRKESDYIGNTYSCPAVILEHLQQLNVLAIMLLTSYASSHSSACKDPHFMISSPALRMI